MLDNRDIAVVKYSTCNFQERLRCMQGIFGVLDVLRLGATKILGCLISGGDGNMLRVVDIP